MIEKIIGVGPHDMPWPDGLNYDKELLANGDKRNVIDKYRYWTVEAIKADLDKTRLPLEIAIENWQHDMNIGTIVRNANAFNLKAVHIIGKKHWNKRGAMVTDVYMNIFYHKSVDEFVKSVGDRHIIAIDNQPGAFNLSEIELPEDCVLVFGGEGPGLSREMIEASEKMVQIEQFGSTRSVNVGVASGIIIYSWITKNLQN
jgi:tRNA G18 (ribose-2'-O)-methylase SpoU